MSNVESELRKLSSNFVTNMKALRHANNMSVSDMSNVTGVSYNTIQRIERARKSRFCTYEPRLKTVMKVAEAAGCKIEDLIETRL